MSRGVTFIELLLVISLIAILAGLSSSFYSRFLTQNSVENTVTQLVNSLRKAQTYSQSGRGNTNWGVYNATASSELVFYRGSSYSSRQPQFDEQYHLQPNVEVAGFQDINFARRTGLPTVIGAPSADSYGLTVSGNSSQITITLNSQGGIGR